MLRKMFVLVGCGFMLAALAMAQGEEAELIPKNAISYEVPRVDIAPSIDGVLDDPVWDTAPVASIAWNLSSHQPWRDESDFIGTFQAVWRDQTLYLAIRLRDNEVNTASAVLEEKDRLVIYVDPEHVGTKAEEYRYVFPVQEDRTYEYYPKIFMMWGPVEDVCEFSIDLGHPPRSGFSIGFAVEYHDLDAQREPQIIAWPADEILASDEVGELRLEEGSQKPPHRLSVTWGAIKALF